MNRLVSERLQTYARASLLAGFGLTPIVFNRSTLDTFMLVKLTTIWSFAVISFTLWGISRAPNAMRIPKSNMLLCSAAFLVAAGISAAFSRIPLIAFTGLYERYGGLLSYLLYTAIMLLVVALFWLRPERLSGLCVAGAAASTVTGAYVVIQAAGLDWNRWLAGSGLPATVPSGTFGNPNITGAYLGAALPLSIYLFARSSPRTGARFAFAMILALQATALWLTGTRAGLFAALAASSFFVLFEGRRHRSLIRSAVFVMLASLALLTVVTVSRLPDKQVETEKQVFSSSTLVDRFSYWKTASRIFADHPLLGTGPDTYYAYHPRYRGTVEGGRNGLELPDYPHNQWLGLAAGMGILGVSTFAGLVALAFIYAFRKRKAVDRSLRLLLTTFCSVLVGYLVQGFFSGDLPPVALTGWICLGAIAAIADPGVNKSRIHHKNDMAIPTETRSGSSILTWPRSRWSKLAWGVSGVLLLAIGLRPLVADVKARTGQNASTLSTELSFYSQASNLNPVEAEYHFLAGKSLHGRALEPGNDEQRTDLFKRGLLELARALDMRPGRVAYLTAIAQLNTDWAQTLEPKRFEVANRAWRSVVDYDPTDYQVHKMYARMLGAWAAAPGGNPEEARQLQVRQIHQSLRLKRDQPGAWIQLSDSYAAMGRQGKADAVILEFFGRKITKGEAERGLQEPDPPPLLAATKSGAGPTIGLLLSASALLGFGIMLASRASRLHYRGLPADGKGHQTRPDLASLELLAMAGLWSIAIAIPYLGPLFGIRASPGELTEILAHLLPGALLLTISGLSMRSILKAGAGPFRVSALRLSVLCILAIYMITAEASLLSSLDSNLARWAKALIHIAPGLFTLAVASSMALDRARNMRRQSVPRGHVG